MRSEDSRNRAALGRTSSAVALGRSLREKVAAADPGATRIIRHWPMAMIGLGAVLTVVWTALLIWLAIASIALLI